MFDVLESLFDIFTIGSSSRGGKGAAKIVFGFLMVLLIVGCGLFIYLSYHGGVKHVIAQEVKEVAKAQAKEYVVHKKEEVKEKITESKVFKMVKGNKEENPENVNDMQSDIQKDSKPSLFDKAKLKAEQKWEEHKIKKDEPVNAGA